MKLQSKITSILFQALSGCHGCRQPKHQWSNQHWHSTHLTTSYFTVPTTWKSS